MLTPEFLAARLVLGSIFLISGFSKISSSTSFVDEVMEYQLLPRRLAPVVARILPFTELALGVFCIVGIVLAIVTSLAILLLLTFTTAIVINLIRGRRFSCHCFGRVSSMIGPAIVIRNILLTGVALFITLQSLSMLTVNAVVTLWHMDMQQLFHPDTLFPIVAIVLLSLGMLFLLNEIDAVLSGGKSKSNQVSWPIQLKVR